EKYAPLVESVQLSSFFVLLDIIWCANGSLSVLIILLITHTRTVVGVVLLFSATGGVKFCVERCVETLSPKGRRVVLVSVPWSTCYFHWGLCILGSSVNGVLFGRFHSTLLMG
ncbi:unnamed protein product, partial [Pylaiella littoralis]